jgi:hypothetical protein
MWFLIQEENPEGLDFRVEAKMIRAYQCYLW